MRYSVIWTPAALAALAEIWTNTNRQNSVTAASARIDEQLATSPFEVGESRVGMIRVFIQFLLGVLYEVDEPGRRVEVTAVWSIRPPKS
jgi:plasmid stabilization system protein ParE